MRDQKSLAVGMALTLGSSLGVVAAAEIEEVLVTAQKRAESAQDVPISIAAYGEQRLEEAGFDGFDDLARMSPSMQFGNFGPVTFVNMRGIGNENTTAGGDPGVALHYDGVYMGRPVASLFTAFDSERVEILRGPQGTLYGRNATGGSINYITKKPGEDLGGEFDLTLGDYNWVRARAAINAPISDNVRSRFVAFVEDRDGFSENAFPGGTEANDADNWGFRAHFAFDLNDRASLLLSGTFLDAGGVGTKAELREAFPGTTTDPITNLGGPPGFAFSPGGPGSGIPPSNNYRGPDGVVVTNDLRPFRENKDLRESQDNDFLVVSATLDWEFDRFLIKSITAYAESSFESHQDEDYGPLDLAELVLTEDADQFTQEFQILSNDWERWNWIAGLYYFDETAARQSEFFRSRYDVFASIFGVTSGFDVGGVADTRSLAAFGQATFDVSDTVSLTAGARYTDDEKEGFNRGFQFAGAPYNDPVGDSWSEVTYRFAVDWSFADQGLLFASYSTGYKSGGINQVAAPSRGATNAVYDPEFVDAFEIGVKSTVLDGRLRLNAALYRNEYDDLQFQIFGPGGPEAFNARGATVQGIEIEGLAALTDTFGLDFSIGYTDSEFDDQVVGGVELGGNQVQRTPDLTWSIGISKDWELDTRGSLRLRADYSYTDEMFYTAFNRVGGFGAPGGSDLADSYDNLNVRLFWYSPSDKWTVELAATNLTDETQEGNILRGIGFLDFPGGGGPEDVTYDPPRQVSARVGYRF